MNVHIDEREIVELTRELVRCPSINPPGNTTACAEIILNKFIENKISAEIIEPKKGLCNIVARIPGKNKGKILVLNGHLDVVPPGENWTVDPFGGEIRDDFIYGRGTSDMKSGIASIIAAMLAFKRSGALFDGEIIFTGVAEEETAGKFGTVYLLENGIGADADFAIVAEPTSLKVGLGNRGLRWFDIVVKGQASHAGIPHLGINAITYAAKLVEAIDAMEFKSPHDVLQMIPPNISITMINGGTKENVIPERCNLVVDRRMVPGETEGSILEDLIKITELITKGEKGLEIEIKIRPNHFDPYIISPDEPIVRATVESLSHLRGEKPDFIVEAYCTDASHLFHKAGIPTVIFGPGNENLCHKPDECVAIADIVLSSEIFLSIFDEVFSR